MNNFTTGDFVFRLAIWIPFAVYGFVLLIQKCIRESRRLKNEIHR